MAAWASEELDRIGNAAELHLASIRDDRSLRPYVTMWVVRSGDDVYVRSAGGSDRPWYRRARASGDGEGQDQVLFAFEGERVSTEAVTGRGVIIEVGERLHKGGMAPVIRTCVRAVSSGYDDRS